MWARNGRWVLLEITDFHVASFTCRKSTTWDRRLYFPSEGRRAEDFFALKNPTASAGFEPVNLDTKGQHATSRPPKPLRWWCREICEARHHDRGAHRFNCCFSLSIYSCLTVFVTVLCTSMNNQCKHSKMWGLIHDFNMQKTLGLWHYTLVF